MLNTPADLLGLLTAPAQDPRPAPSVLLLAAHPDDEVIGAGCRLPRLRDRLVLAHVTDGSPQNVADARASGLSTCDAYARARRDELRSALGLAGCPNIPTITCGLTDQTVALHLADLTQRVASLVREYRPAVLLTHPYEGGHPDHDATAFAAAAALCVLRSQGDCVPILLEMTSYHNGPAGLTSGVFLPDDTVATVISPLTPTERAFKQRLFACFTTQQGTLQYFRTDVEAFRVAPAYDFTRPPHEGTLFYEQYDWGMTGQRFRALAATAGVELGVVGTA